MVKISKASIESIPIIQQMSKIVWPITFAEILSEEQIVYMMEMMYSTKSLTEQIAVKRHNYILAQKDNEYLGYLSFENQVEDDYCKIHKIYVLPTAQGLGVGKELIEHVKQQITLSGESKLRLNVNRYNKALNFYKHLGFSILKTENIDIGNGFLMEDYVLEMKL